MKISFVQLAKQSLPEMDTKRAYEILGIPNNSSLEEVKSAYLYSDQKSSVGKCRYLNCSLIRQDLIPDLIYTLKRTLKIGTSSTAFANYQHQIPFKTLLKNIQVKVGAKVIPFWSINWFSLYFLNLVFNNKKPHPNSKQVKWAPSVGEWVCDWIRFVSNALSR